MPAADDHHDVPAAELLRARRIVASPAALDQATYPPDTLVLRIAPDDVLVIGGGALLVDDPHAIIEDECGFVSWSFPRPAFDATVAPFVEWELPSAGPALAQGDVSGPALAQGDVSGPALAQGCVAGIPAKLWFEAGRVVLVANAAYAHELIGRLS